jgi:hypothetical protein
MNKWSNLVRPLEGVRVADLTWLLAGAGGPRLLASLGAEIIRIEWRDRLDFLRYMPPFAPAQNEGAAKAGAMDLSGLSKDSVKSVNRSGYFNQYNLGKLSLSLDLKGVNCSSVWLPSAMWWSRRLRLRRCANGASATILSSRSSRTLFTAAARVGVQRTIRQIRFVWANCAGCRG